MSIEIDQLHSWDVSYAQAVSLQRELAKKVTHSKIEKQVRFAAGLDCAFSKDGKRILAVSNVVDLESKEMIELVSAELPVTFPYIPGLLSFREGPVCLEALKKLGHRVDVILVDGQGIAHPRRLGLASHLGLFVNVPVIGCAKSRLVGEHDEPGVEKGSTAVLRHKGEKIGMVVRTRESVKPVFVSVGNCCTLEDSVDIVLLSTSKYRLPEPLRFAHREVTRLRK